MVNVISHSYRQWGSDLENLSQTTLRLHSEQLRGRHGSADPAEGEPMEHQKADTVCTLTRETGHEERVIA